MKVVISLILFVFCFVINNYHPVSAMNQYESLGYDTLEEAEGDIFFHTIRKIYF